MPKRNRGDARQECWCDQCRGHEKSRSTVNNHSDRPRWVPPLAGPAPVVELEDVADADNWDPHMFSDNDDDDDDDDGGDGSDDEWAADLRRRMWEDDDVMTDLEWSGGLILTVLESICLLQSVAAKHRSSIASLKKQYEATCLLLPPGHGMVSYHKAQVHTTTKYSTEHLLTLC
jgi:hypothetical protein